jgi:Rrf2 family protein
MKLSSATRYAVHALAYMASQKQNTVIPSHLVAQKQGMPERFLLKVLKPLATAGVLQSLKGPNGGYRLARPANKISLLEVMEAVDGPIQGKVSFEGVDTRGLERRLQAICNESADIYRAYLRKVRLSEIVAKR